MTNELRTLAYFLCTLLACPLAALAQTPSPSPSPASSDIFLIRVENRHGRMKPGEPARINDYSGYNNQPFFLPDGRGLLYTSIRADKQADIYRYEIPQRRTTRITQTPESEFSPTLMPGGKFMSVVRVEADGTQRLWKFPRAGGAPTLALENIKPIGYHWWIDNHTVALFILGKPNTLQIADIRTGKAKVITENPGRILRLIPHRHKLSFVHKISDQEWIIKAFDLQTQNITTLIKTLPGVEDYAWTPAGVLLMAKDAKIFAWNSPKHKDWHEIADFSAAGLKSITRITVSPKGDRLAIVARRDSGQ